YFLRSLPYCLLNAPLAAGCYTLSLHDALPILGLADDVLHRNRAPDAPAALHARVAGVVAVVAHDEHRPLGHGDLGELLLTRASARLEVQVRLVQRLAVDEHPVLRVTALDGLAADGDDPLDEVPLVRRREPDHRPELTEETGDSGALLDLLVPHPRARALEHHHVTGLRVGEPVGDLVHQHPVRRATRAAVQRQLH